MSFVEIRDLSKSFGVNRVVRDIDLNIERGEFISLLGPSGCGKTTVLRMIAGFETANAGTIVVDGEDITDLRPARRAVGMVFQSYALFPNMNVQDNIAFGLKVAGATAAKIRDRVAEMLDLVKLPSLGGRYPYQLSGGQQQRVALARALAVSPRILLLDEPLSALDAKIRVSLREEIRSVQRALGITTVFVTHDQEEALSTSDRVVVMNEGRIEQLGTPFEVYSQPRTRFVASFVGTLTILAAEIVDPDNGTVSLEGQIVRAARALPGRPGQPVLVALRPEALVFGEGHGSANRVSATVVDVNFLGSIVRVKARCASQLVSIDMFNQHKSRPPIQGQSVVINFDAEDLVVLEGPADPQPMMT